MGRAKIAAINSGLSVANLFITNILQFVYRTVLVYILGVQYAGISGLCMNVIGIFALSELGISWAISFYLYKPLKENNTVEVAGIVFFLKKLYRCIGIFILLSGVAVIPFLDRIIKDGNDIPYLSLIFTLFLCNTAVSYLFFSYYQILANADRKNFVLFAPQTIGNILMVCGQIAAIYLFHSFVVAVVIMVVSTISINYIIRLKVLRLYPYLNEHSNTKLNDKLKHQIVKYIKSTMLYKISLTVMTSSTGVIISHYIGLVILGIYANNMLIVDTIRSLILSLINPMTAVVGEIASGTTAEEKEVAYKRLNFLMNWICYFCAISLYCLLTPFITLWIGPENTLSPGIVTLISLYFYIEFIISFSTKFRDACGLNNIGKFRPLLTAVCNVVLAILLVQRLELTGIILALLISRLATMTWFEPWIVHKYVLNKPVGKYYLSLLGNLIFTIIIAAGISYLINLIWQRDVVTFIAAMLICLIVPNALFYLVHRNSDELKYYLSILSIKITRR